MPDQARQLLQSHLDNTHLAVFADRLTAWLVADLNQSEEKVPDFTESRAKALLRATDLIDDPTLHSFARLVEKPTAARVALYDLLKNSSLASENEVQALAATAGQAPPPAETSISWMALAVAAFAWKSGYPLYQLDPASPPQVYSPAGQLLKRAAYFMRQQVQRSATERDKIGRQLAYSAESAATGEPQQPEQPVAPLPPHYRSPVPVRYPEVARDTIHIDEEEAPDSTLEVPPEEPETPAVSRGDPITITDEDLEETQRPTTMPPIRIDAGEVRPQPPRSRVVTSGTGTPQPRPSLRPNRGHRRGNMTTTKLRIVVQEHPDGPGYYGVQVRINSRSAKTHVAGTTNQDGKLLCELPVPVNAGLTYNIEVTWPRDVGGDVERKSITLNADRTEFTIPFYRRHNPAK